MKLRIAHITDLHLDEDFPQEQGVDTRKNLEIILNDIRNKELTHIICTGDIGESQSIPYFINRVKDYLFTLTLGNHDTYEEVTKYYSTGNRSKDKKLYSSEEKLGYKFIYLDSSSGHIDHIQLTWLGRELVTSLPIVMFIHHPIIGSDLMVDNIGKLENREEILNTLQASNKIITIFCGHYHMEQHQTHKKIHQYITPAVSFQIEKKKDKIVIDPHTFGYRIVSFEQGKISSEVQTFHAK